MHAQKHLNMILLGISKKESSDSFFFFTSQQHSYSTTIKNEKDYIIVTNSIGRHVLIVFSCRFRYCYNLV